MSLDQILQGFQSTQYDFLTIIANLVVAAFLASGSAIVYRYTHSGFSYSKSYFVTIISVALVTLMIMMTITSYLSLSLGLIGALSVIRFRTPIKDPKDMAYLFLSIGIGLSCSIGSFTIAFTSTIFINAVFLILHYLKIGTNQSGSYSLIFNYTGALTELDSCIEKLKNNFKSFELKSFNEREQGVIECVASFELGKLSEPKVLELIKSYSNNNAKSVNLISPVNSIEV
ncbi:MAG: DUF4956 domain-containing protein [Bdellovibrionales bacterium]